jgi:DNA-binding MarR family transcriptional regulator
VAVRPRLRPRLRPQPWLTPEQQLAWRQYLQLQARLSAHLNRRLQADSGLSLADFDVLVQLSESATGRLRVFELGAALNWEKSRVSHQVRRMQTRGLVERQECEDDGRGAFVVLTDQGRSAIDEAAPAHADLVRRIVFDDLSPAQVTAFTAVAGAVLARLDAELAARDRES